MNYGSYDVYFDHDEPQPVGRFEVSERGVKIVSDPDELLAQMIVQGPMSSKPVLHGLLRLDHNAHYKLVKVR